MLDPRFHLVSAAAQRPRPAPIHGTAVHDALVAVNVTSASRADPRRDGWQVGADAAPGACAPDAGELGAPSDALDAGALASLALGLVFLFIIFARGCA